MILDFVREFWRTRAILHGIACITCQSTNTMRVPGSRSTRSCCDCGATWDQQTRYGFFDGDEFCMPRATTWPVFEEHPAPRARHQGMPTIAPTAATPPPRPVTTGPLPPPLPEPATGSGTGTKSLRLKVTGWMEEHLGKAALPVAALAGGVAGGTLGMLTLGPVGALAGGAAGAFFGGVFFMAG